MGVGVRAGPFVIALKSLNGFPWWNISSADLEFLRDYGLSRCCIDKILRRSYRRSSWDGWGAGLFVIAVSFFNILRIEAHFN